MGAAKIRGSFEERRAAAVVRDKAREEERQRAEEARLRNMTPEERRRWDAAQSVLGMALALGGSFGGLDEADRFINTIGHDPRRRKK